MPHLTLYIPGLMGPPVPLAEADLPDLPLLEKLLGRARCRRFPGDGYYAVLGHLLDLETDADNDIPAAAVCRLVDSEEHPDGIWMRADPVHLTPNRDRVILLDAAVVNLNRRDALAVATEVRQVLAAEGWQLEVPAPDRWYIRLAGPPGVTTTDLARVAGQDINAFLPAGPEATRFHRLLNEIQMQLHECDINQDRAGRGELPVNSLWFWGLGPLPTIPPRSWSAVYTDDPFAAGLARLSMTPCHEVPDTAEALLEPAWPRSRRLAILDHCRLASQYADLRRWQEGLLELEQYWLPDLVRALQQGYLQSLELVAGGAGFTLSRYRLARFWRRSRSVLRFSHRPDRHGGA